MLWRNKRFKTFAFGGYGLDTNQVTIRQIQSIEFLVLERKVFTKEADLFSFFYCLSVWLHVFHEIWNVPFFSSFFIIFYRLLADLILSQKSHFHFLTLSLLFCGWASRQLSSGSQTDSMKWWTLRMGVDKIALSMSSSYESVKKTNIWFWEEYSQLIKNVLNHRHFHFLTLSL